jgi:uncharacterized protein
MQYQVKLPPDVAKKLGYYVYLYVDPETDEIFYVGKGKGNRAFDHLADTVESEKTRRIKEIIARGQKPTIEILAHGLSGEKEALIVESAVIDAFGSKNLTNAIRGWKSGTYGRMGLDQIVAQYGASEAEITHQVVLIRINRLFRYGLTPIELYDITRGLWKVGPQRDSAQFALPVFDGVVQEVYRIASWFPAGSTLSTRDHEINEERYEFVGSIAEGSVRDRYLQKSVRSYFPPGSQNPIRYVNL